MTEKEFIENELKKFIKQFSNTRVRYEYHELSDAHFIEIVPSGVYNLNDEYLEWEYDVYSRFTELYPMEGICFVSDDAVVKIKNAKYTLYGEEYTPISAIRENIDFAPINSSVKMAIGCTFSIDEKREDIEQILPYFPIINYLTAA